MVDRCGHPAAAFADATFSHDDLGACLVGNQGNPSRISASEQVPQGLSHHHLSLGVQGRSVQKPGSELADESGLFLTGIPTVGAAVRVHRLAAVRAHRNVRLKRGQRARCGKGASDHESEDRAGLLVRLVLGSQRGQGSRYLREGIRQHLLFDAADRPGDTEALVAE